MNKVVAYGLLLLGLSLIATRFWLAASADSIAGVPGALSIVDLALFGLVLPALLLVLLMIVVYRYLLSRYRNLSNLYPGELVFLSSADSSLYDYLRTEDPRFTQAGFPGAYIVRISKNQMEFVNAYSGRISARLDLAPHSFHRVSANGAFKRYEALVMRNAHREARLLPIASGSRNYFKEPSSEELGSLVARLNQAVELAK